MNKLTTTEFTHKSKLIHDDKYDYSYVEYVDYLTKVNIICKQHGMFSQQPRKHLQGQGCKLCAVRKTDDQFITDAIKIHGNKYDYSLVKYNSTKSKIKIICPIHGEFEQESSSHLMGYGCSDCSNKKKKTTNRFILESKKIHGDKYDYSLVEYKNLLSNVSIICNIHGEFTQRAKKHLYGQGCPICNLSKGETKIKILLDNNDIKYIRQHKFNECKYKKPLQFDFYLPEYNCCLEYDGIQHTKPIDFFGGIESFNDLTIKDNIKNNYCKNNNIKLIRVNHTETLEKLIYKIKAD